MDLRVRTATSSTVEFDGEVITRLTVEWLLSHLTEEEREIMQLWVVEELTNAEIGKIVGLKHRGRELTGSAIRYRKDRIKEKLEQFRTSVDE